MDFLWRKVSEKEKEDIKKQAKSIMDSFSKKLSKIDKKISEPLIEREKGEREECEKCKEDFSREIMFENAPEKNKDFIIGEKKGW
jgi:Asp-tRNA(Asn)/Glu-tRNA(Gln) amidotransferase C subunit